MSRVLVTGAAGFIARHLIPILQNLGHEVVGFGHDAGNVADEATWDGFPPSDVVVHLAARLFVPDSWVDPTGFARTNVMGTLAALNYCRRHGAALVYLSSYLYGQPACLPIAEDAPIDADNPYALSKYLAEQVCRFYATRWTVPVTVMRPFNVFGPGQREPFLVPFILRQLGTGREIRVKDLEPRRDYVYVADVATAIGAAIRTVQTSRRYRILNIGCGVSYSVREVIDAIQHVWGTDLPVVCEGERRRAEILDTVADISAARRELNWTPAFNLQTGLEDMRRQYKQAE